MHPQSILIQLLLFFCFFHQAFGQENPRLRAMVASLPEKALTVDFVVYKAIQNSDTYRSIRSQEKTLPALTWASELLFEPKFFAESKWTDDQSEPLSPFATSRSKTHTLSLGVNTYFVTGTSLGVAGYLYRQRYDYSPQSGFSGLSGDQSSLILSAEQNIGKDFFGFSTRAKKEGQTLEAELMEIQIQQAKEKWFLEILQLYYHAWLSQKNTWIAKERVEKREFLLRVAKEKRRRGTMEEPDYLQTLTEVRNSKIDFENQKILLEKIWKDLVIKLKLPPELAAIDPMLIPMKAEPRKEAEVLCGNVDQRISRTDLQGQKNSRELEKARLQMQEAKWNQIPDLKVGGKYASNGIEPIPGRSSSFQEALRRDHPSYEFYVKLEMPLFRYAERIEKAKAQAELDRAESYFAGEGSDWKSEISFLCKKNELLRDHEKTKEENQHENLKRLNLETQRFQLGRVGVYEFIRASDDYFRSQLDFLQLVQEQRILQWELKQKSIGLFSELSQWEKR